MLRAWQQENKDEPRSRPTFLLLTPPRFRGGQGQQDSGGASVCVNTALTVSVWPPTCDMLPLLVFLCSQDQGLL